MSGFREPSESASTDAVAEAGEEILTRDEFEARLRAEIERRSAATPAMLHSINEAGVLISVSNAWLAKLGYSRDEVLGRRSTDFMTAESRERAINVVVPEFFRSGGVDNVHYQMVKKDGGVIDVLMSGVVAEGLPGHGRISLAVTTDITALLESKRRVLESEARYRFLAENSNDMILLVGPDGKRLYASPACRTLLGYDPDETVAMRLQDAIHPDDAANVLPVLAARPGDTLLTYRMRRKDGSFIWVETTGKTVEVAGQEPQRLIIVRDIDQRIAADQRVKLSEARYRLLADNSSDMVFQLDGDLVRRYVSPACREILGYEPDEMLGISPASMSHPEDAPRVTLAFNSLMHGGAERLSIINRIRHKDGRWIWVEAQLRTLKDPKTNRSIGVIGALRDISMRKAVEDELAEANRRLIALAGQDALTGLANRRAFDEALEREFRRARRDECSIALIMLDVDRFKAFNDLYGHPAGDDCLRRIAGAIEKAARRAADLAARYGGEEFAVVLPNTDEADAVAIARRIQQEVAHLQIEHTGGDCGVVTISAGAAAIRPTESNEAHEALTREADRALYMAKKAGRNTVIPASASNETPGPTNFAAA